MKKMKSAQEEKAIVVLDDGGQAYREALTRDAMEEAAAESTPRVYANDIQGLAATLAVNAY